ncbi:MAG: ATP-binding protein [Pirellulales bacterium]
MFVTARSRMTFGLACILVSVLCTAMTIGLVPERESALLAGRAELCETIAMCGSDYLARGEMRRLEHLLQSIVERNEGLLSAGLRQANGKLVTEVGDHAAQWTLGADDRSTGSNVHVPLRSGKEKWGAIELRFQPLDTATTAGFSNAWISLTVFVAAGCYVLFFFYLGRMLKHLDPSKAVPKRVRAALDSLAEGLLVIDREGRIVLANQAIAAWIGRAPEKLIGLAADKLNWVANEENEPLESYPWVRAIELESPQAGIMLGLARKDHPTQILIANASPVLGHDGKYRGVLVSFDDVTQLEEVKKGLNVARQVAEDANRAKSDFLACMSHEIRTPMNAILGFTDVLRRGFDESTQDRQNYLNTIHASGEHLLALINDILDLSKIESGHMELEQQRCSPHQIIMEVVTLLRSKSEEKAIGLEFRTDGPLPETIQTDPVRLRQTVMNLAGNAIKFTDQGKVQIVARLAGDGPAALLAIDVIDSGIGISEENQQRIFNPFSQADSTITRRFGGTGLGLAISRKLATAMGGGISVASTLGQGSTFTVTINPGPLADVPLIETEAALAKVAQQSAKGKQTLRLPPAKILVADDGESNRNLIQLVLRRAGVEVVLVENGQQAVDAALSQHFDLILMDMQMPVLDGYAATAALRQSGYELPIIALTAHAMQGNEEKCRAAGCSEFLTKPINIDRLLAKLAEVLAATSARGSIEPQPSPPVEAVRPVPDAVPVVVPAAVQPPAPVVVAETPVADAPPATEQPGHTEPQHSEEEASEADSLSADSFSVSPIECEFPLDDLDFLAIATSFAASLSRKLAAMREAHARGDGKELALLAHWLKGSGGTAGFDAFTKPARELEQACHADDRPQWAVLIGRLENMAARINLPSAAEVPSEETRPARQADSAIPSSSLPQAGLGFQSAVEAFVDQLQENLVLMEQAAAANDYDSLAALARWLKKSGVVAGYDDFTPFAKALGPCCQQRNAAQVAHILGDLRQVVERTCSPAVS